MRISKLALAAVLTGGLALGGCAYGYDPYGGGYGGVSVGYSSGYGYGSPYGGYGYGYGDPYGYGGYGGYGGLYGWYGDYYYPGSGVYVYDRHHHRRQWSDAERQYWRNRFAHAGTGTTTTSTGATNVNVAPRENWSGFNRVRTRGVDTTGTSTTRSSDRGRWWGRSSGATTSTSTDTTTRPSEGWRGRGHRSHD